MTIADGQAPRVLPGWLGPEWELSMQVCWQAHRLAALTIAFAQHAGGQKSRSADLHNDVAHMSQGNRPVDGLLVDYIASRCT